MFRIVRTLSIAVLTVLVALTTGCGGGTGSMTGLPGGVTGNPQTETGSLALRITRSDLGLPPTTSRSENQDPVVTVTLTADDQATVQPDPQTLTGEAVEFQITGLQPATWTIVVTATLGETVLASGRTTATVERGQTTQVFVPLVTAPPTPTAGSVTLGVGTLVDVPNGTEIRVGSDHTWMVQAPAVYVGGVAQYPGMVPNTRMRVELYATSGGSTRYNDNYISIAEYDSADGSEPELETSSDGSLIRAIRMKAGDRMTVRWSQIPRGQREVVISTQRGAKDASFPGQDYFIGLGQPVEYRYPILN